MNVHHLQLAAIPFDAIKDGIKIIESRLYDDKRQRIKLGDEITFTNRDTPNQTIAVRVVDLHRHEIFHDLFSHNEPTKFGGSSVEWLDRQINEFYSEEDQKKYGVIGIEFELMPRPTR